MTAVVYLLEGPDGAGKTTFIRSMIREEEAQGRKPRYFHNGPEDAKLPGSLYRHYRAQMLDAVDFRDKGVSTYIDRSFLSEVIYGGVYRGKSRISVRQQRKLEALAKAKGIALVGLVASPEVRHRRLRQRHETWDETDVLIGLIYRAYFQINNMVWITADGSSVNSK